MKRSRSASESLLAFLRTRTISGTEPARAVPIRASSETSPFFALGWPNFPAVKKETEDPLVGTVKVSALAKAPVVPARNTMAPPPGADLPESFRLTVGPGAPAGLVTRIRQGDGAQDTNRVLGFRLLL